ncbi:outer membrane protein transport protein [Serratia symbiotica]|uniref:outer membrane protein transport protein n=1 Tax=Serratia symbiotica TaxID=138074 RepID=UPI00077BDD9F|nr:outer membrane protein transport protein [Serratia symbiotica]
MRQKNHLLNSVIAIAVAVISSQTLAAGFQLNEFSATGLGRAYSVEGAIADTAASASRNPATLMRYTRPEFSIGAIFIDPQVDISGKSPSGASLDANNIAPSAWVPNLHYVHPINQQFALGGSVTSNYGLATKYNDGYMAGSVGGKTDLKTLNVNLSGAYRLNQHFSFGLGCNAVYARDENNRYSFTYRSVVKIKFDGNYKSDLPTQYNPFLGAVGLPLGTSNNTIPAHLPLNLPEIGELSGYNKVAPQWAVHYNLTYTRWSQFKELKATNNEQVLLKKNEDFRDAYRTALGVTYFYDDNWIFRTGIAFDVSPVAVQYRSISIPDQNRLWLSTGVSYAFNKDASVDVGVSYMHGQKTSIKEGPYTFDSMGKAWLYGASFNCKYTCFGHLLNMLTVL